MRERARSSANVGMAACPRRRCSRVSARSAITSPIGRTLTGALTIVDLTFLAGSFRRLRNLLEGFLAGFSSTAAEALYLDDLFDFIRVGCSPISMYPKHCPLVARGV
jgi:hypothetical protein